MARTPWEGTGFMDRGQALVVGRRLVLINGSGVETRSPADGAPLAFVQPDSWPDLSDPEAPLALVAGDVVSNEEPLVPASLSRSLPARLVTGHR
ncbi:hypothetical protein PV371_25680 [Streptomyces sp. TX20-6-3]|uniref:hypothetical protein n=1 Tax=Streptomyces sp. TX20-6-3 TaxID=3028705 RepID=UPI0029A9ACAF|nr:hypothetical protein [Streptomyces sp. TX20-6-3]MDX2563023.1 hypothetical protein [Streptomyces sp. TX20-6-3]